MSVWIGALGSMVETLCASELPVASEDRWMTGGGAGTLAPSRHLMLTAHGPGSREWRFGRGVCEAPDAASLCGLHPSPDCRRYREEEYHARKQEDPVFLQEAEREGAEKPVLVHSEQVSQKEENLVDVPRAK